MAYGTANVDTIQSSTAGTPPQFNDGNGTQVGTLCRAWVNFDGTAATPITPRSSFNVSSVTKTASGDYTLNFTSSLSDANYSVVGSCNVNISGSSGRTVSAPYNQAPTTSAVRIATTSASNTLEAQLYVYVAVFR